jgi:predicted permease
MECALLAAAGCTAGLLLALWIVGAIPALVPPVGLPIAVDLRLDSRVLLFTLAVAAVAVPVFGLLPALVAARGGVAPALRGVARDDRRRMRCSLRDVLVVGQIAVSVVLLVGAILVVRALGIARTIDPGFERRPMLLLTVVPSINGYTGAQSKAYLEDLVARAAALPGVERVSLARRMPLSADGGGATEDVTIPGYDAGAGEGTAKVPFNVVGLHFFETLGTRLLRGRDFEPGDRGGPGVVIVNEEMARRFWPRGPVIGQPLKAGPAGSARPYQVVGVVQNVRWSALNEPVTPQLYFFHGQRPAGEATLVIRTAGDEAAVVPALRAILRELDPTMPTLQLVTLRQHLRYALAGEEAVSVFGASLGIAGLLLAAIGLYGVISYFVSRRAHELGMRLALGATPGLVMRLVLSRGLSLAVVGAGTGLVAALAAARLLRRALYGLSPVDPISLLVVATTVVSITLVASFVPARRAAHLDPVQTLRAE